jgi:hypothetical protein
MKVSKRIDQLSSLFFMELPVPLLEQIFVGLQQRFGFQHDNVGNQLDAVLAMIQSRASALDGDWEKAVAQLHHDTLSGPRANYRIWYFSLPLLWIDDYTIDIDQAGDEAEATRLHFTAQWNARIDHLR